MITMSWPQYLRHECTVSGFRVKLSATQTELLLALLLRHPDHMTPGELAEMIWFDREEPDYKTPVADLVRRLRAQVGAFRVASNTRTGYWLVQEPGDQRRRRITSGQL